MIDFGYVLVDEGHFGTLSCDVAQLLRLKARFSIGLRSETVLMQTHESASTAADEHDVLRQVGCAVGKRVARVVDDGGVLADSVEGQGVLDSERKRAEVRDRVVGNTGNREVLEGNDRVVERGDGDRVDGVTGAGAVPRTDRAVVACVRNAASVSDFGPQCGMMLGHGILNTRLTGRDSDDASRSSNPARDDGARGLGPTIRTTER